MILLGRLDLHVGFDWPTYDTRWGASLQWKRNFLLNSVFVKPTAILLLRRLEMLAYLMPNEDATFLSVAAEASEGFVFQDLFSAVKWAGLFLAVKGGR